MINIKSNIKGMAIDHQTVTLRGQHYDEDTLNLWYTTIDSFCPR